MQWWCAATGDPWSWAWRPYPGVWCFVLLLAALAGWRLQRGGPATPLAVAPWAAAVLVAWLALDWPLGALGAGYLLAAHTLQYLLLTFAVAPLLLLGWSATVREATRDGAQLPGAHPIATLLLYNTVLAVTHVPTVVDRLMATQMGAAGIDLGWLLAGVALWWPVLHPDPRRRLSPPAQIGYLFASTILPTIPAALLTFATYPVYAIYEFAPRALPLSAREDQQLAGLLMKLGTDPFVWVAMAVSFFRWQAATDEESLRPATPWS